MNLESTQPEPENDPAPNAVRVIDRRKALRSVGIVSVVCGLGLWTLLTHVKHNAGARETLEQSNKTASAKPGVDRVALRADLELNFDILRGDLDRLQRTLDRDLQREHRAMAAELEQAGAVFADEKLTRRNIVHLVSLMAMDHFDEQGRADAWFAEHLDPQMLPVMRRFEKRVQTRVDLFYQELANSIEDFERRSLQTLQYHGVEINGGLTMAHVRRYTDPMLLEAGIRRTAGTVAGTTVAIGGVTLAATGALTAAVAISIRRAAYRMLRPAVAKLVARLTAAYSTAWIPIAGAVIATGGTFWSAYDVYKLRGDTIEGFKEGLQEFIDESQGELRNTIILPVNQSLNALRDHFRPTANALARL